MTGASGVRWRVLALLVVASFVSYLLRSNISIAAPAMTADLGLSEQQLGYILAAFTAGYTVFQFPGGVFGVKLGPRRALAIVMVLWGLLTVLTSAVPGGAAAVGWTLAALIVVRFLVGAVHAPIYPLTGGVVERWFPIGSWALPNGLSSSGLTLGSAAAAPLLAWLVVEYGWRVSFVLLAPLGLVGAALWWWYVRDDPASHPAVNEAEAELILAGRPEPVPPSAAEAEQPGWLRVLKNRDVLLLMQSYFCMNYIFYLMFNWVFYYLVTVRGFESQLAGYFTSIQWVAAAVGAAGGGFLCDLLCRRYGMRRGCAWPTMAGLTLSGLFLVIGAVSVNPYLAVAFLALCFLANQVTEAGFWAAAISIGGRNAAAACGVMNTGGNAAGVVNALLVPFLAGTLGWVAAMVAGAAFAFAAAALWLAIRADRTIAG